MKPNCDVTIFHTDDCGKTYEKTYVRNAFLAGEKKVTFSNRNSVNGDMMCVRIKNFSGDAYVGDKVVLSYCDGTSPYSYKYYTIIKCTKNAFGSKYLRHIKLVIK